MVGKNERTYLDLSSLSEIEKALSMTEENKLGKLAVKSDEFFKHAGALVDFMRLQFLITYAKQYQSGDNGPSIHFHKSNNKADLFKNFELTTTSVVIAEFYKNIFIGEENINIGEINYIEKAKEYLKNMGKIQKGGESSIFCIHGKKINGLEFQFPHALFTIKAEYQVRNANEIKNLLMTMFSSFYNNNKLEIDYWAFARFVYELFDNTQKHATKSFLDKEDFFRHIEGILLNFPTTKSKLEILTKDKEIDPELVNNINELFFDSQEKKEKGTFFCNLSFIDSGDGFVSHYIQKSVKDIEIDEEFNILMQRINASGNKNIQKELKPDEFGYRIVLENLHRTGGIIIIRTGRLCLYNFFSASENEPSDNMLFNFKSLYVNSGSTKAKKLALVTGSLISIIIPLNASKKSDGKNPQLDMGV
ncbi:MAG: hypothetical protein QM537_02640 [Candidatus Symbiobacter sp.]|nr:hypothetical protein [Candidatus Symbiobacter sp.]